jgi:hypothetical protein
MRNHKCCYTCIQCREESGDFICGYDEEPTSLEDYCDLYVAERKNLDNAPIWGKKKTNAR